MTLVILLTVYDVPRTLETSAKSVSDFEPPWWSYEKFYASVISNVSSVPLAIYIYTFGTISVFSVIEYRVTIAIVVRDKLDDGEGITKFYGKDPPLL